MSPAELNRRISEAIHAIVYDLPGGTCAIVTIERVGTRIVTRTALLSPRDAQGKQPVLDGLAKLGRLASDN